MRRATALLLSGALVLASPSPAAAYLKFGLRLDSSAVDIRWGEQPIRYFITERDGPGASAGQLRDAVARAFATWQAVPSASVRAEFLGFTTAPPELSDGRTTFGFLDRPDLERVLGATSFLLDGSTGRILEVDVYFNTRFDWSVAPNGETGRIDLESVALHEIGHLLGLGHSAIGETELGATGGRRVLGSGAVMFPIALGPGTIADRVLQADDVAGISDLYGTTAHLSATGSITGRVTLDGQGVFGAHVVAFSPRSGALVGGFTLNAAGEFAIAGLEPGPYIVRVEPLDDADTATFLPGGVDLSFGASYFPRTVAAPRGGAATPIEIRVRRR
ncbi:MAG: matrixin family metalloprotease [Acidobacteriota bacterium]